MKKIKLLVSSLFIALAGCGGGESSTSSDVDATAMPSVQAGDQFETLVKVDGHEVVSKIYTYYAVTDSGQLVSDSKPENKDSPHFALLSSCQVKPMSVAYIHAMDVTPTDACTPLNQAVLMGFWSDVWDAIKKKFTDPNDHTFEDSDFIISPAPETIATEVADFDVSMENLYRNYQNSGFVSVQEFVDFYQTIDVYWDYPTAEGDLANFLNDAGMKANAFLQSLTAAGVSWPQLLSSMKVQGYTFVMLYDAYARSSKTFGAFAYDFVNSGNVAASNMLRPAGNTAIDAGKLGLDVLKFSWSVIEDNKPQLTADGAYTSVYDADDTNPKNYGNPLEGSSGAITYEILVHPKWYYWPLPPPNPMPAYVRVEFGLGGVYGAKHITIPGRFMPSVAFSVSNAEVSWPFKVNANAVIYNVANVGAPGVYVPVLDVEARIQASWVFSNVIESYYFRAHAERGFSLKEGR